MIVLSWTCYRKKDLHDHLKFFYSFFSQKCFVELVCQEILNSNGFRDISIFSKNIWEKNHNIFIFRQQNTVRTPESLAEMLMSRCLDVFNQSIVIAQKIGHEIFRENFFQFCLPNYRCQEIGNNSLIIFLPGVFKGSWTNFYGFWDMFSNTH